MGFSRQEYWSGLPFPSPKVGIGGTTNTITERELTREAGSERALKGDGGQEGVRESELQRESNRRHETHHEMRRDG